VRALVSHVLLEKKNALILDMEAGIEHLSRGTVEDVDRLLIVVEPSRSSIETALRINKLAQELGLHHISVIGNRIKSDGEKDFLREALSEIEFAGFVPFDEKLQQAELAGRPAAGASQAVDDVIARIVRRIEENTHSHSHGHSHDHTHHHHH
jgi:CO dehydrogenase maturation factor